MQHIKRGLGDKKFSFFVIIKNFFPTCLLCTLTPHLFRASELGGVNVVGNSTNAHISHNVGFYGNGGLSTSNEFYAGMTKKHIEIEAEVHFSDVLLVGDL